MKCRLLGVAIGFLVLLIDQASKQWLLRGFGLAARQPVHIAPGVDFVLAWNRGISYSLFTTDSRYGPWVLLILTLAITALLAGWLWRATATLTAVALGLLIGGALGNAYDRFAYGAVVDFVYLHAGSFSWYIFNGADCAIVLGVAVLLVEALRTPSERIASKLPETHA